MLAGCCTALVTPFKGDDIDYNGLDQLIDFQIQNNITGILAVGTTGESPTLSWQEHNGVVDAIARKTKGKCICIAGAGSNNTKEALEATAHAVASGAQAVLLVDPYYNGPSSLEIRKEYIAPVAEAFPNVTIIPYVIPGRTGCQLLPEDLALLYQKHKNVNTVKEATANIENMRRTRVCCGPDFTMLSGDDGMTFDMMSDHGILAAGVISVVSNVAPGFVAEMVRLLAAGKQDDAKQLEHALKPLFGLVTVKTTEKTAFGDVICRARNPLAFKTLMAILGMPSGVCRKPLGRMTRNGLDQVLQAARTVQANNPEIFSPVAEAFQVDIDQRLNDPALWKGLFYESY
jgi:4-hydroxy-tetrahydrodipicolinate synthase